MAKIFYHKKASFESTFDYNSSNKACGPYMRVMRLVDCLSSFIVIMVNAVKQDDAENSAMVSV